MIADHIRALDRMGEALEPRSDDPIDIALRKMAVQATLAGARALLIPLVKQ